MLLVGTIPVLAIVFATIYLIARIFLFLITGYAWYEKALAFLLLAAELFILFHGIG